MHRFVLSGLLAMMLWGCSESPSLTPKPRAYPKVVYPEKAYQSFQQASCPMSFEYPAYAKIQQDSLFFGDTAPSDCWFDLYFADFDCRIHCSYYSISQQKGFEELKKDAFEMVDWHMKKANYINEIEVGNSADIKGFIFDIEGPAASPMQFYLSDEKDHFLRGALYFNTQIKPDSLAPIYEFVKADIVQLIDSFQWDHQ